MTEQYIAGMIGILGAGWLGLPLARALLATVTVSSAEKAVRLQGEGIYAYPLMISADMSDELPIPCESLVICVPPSKTDDDPQAVAA
jgi:hypothetical protein